MEQKKNYRKKIGFWLKLTKEIRDEKSKRNKKTLGQKEYLL